MVVLFYVFRRLVRRSLGSQDLAVSEGLCSVLNAFALRCFRGELSRGLSLKLTWGSVETGRKRACVDS